MRRRRSGARRSGDPRVRSGVPVTPTAPAGQHARLVLHQPFNPGEDFTDEAIAGLVGQAPKFDMAGVPDGQARIVAATREGGGVNVTIEVPADVAELLKGKRLW